MCHQRRIAGRAVQNKVPEDGWHLYEAPSGKGREFDRWPTRVRIAPQPFEPPHALGIDVAEQARRALAGMPPVTGTIVRHYRESPSPLVHDTSAGTVPDGWTSCLEGTSIG